MMLYRTMRPDPDDGLPSAGSGDCELGVRVPQDVRPSGGIVQPSHGGRPQGMSVMADDWTLMNPRLIPEKRGGSGLWGEIFETTDGTFAAPLALRPDRAPHHVVGAAAPMPLANLRSALAATRTQWRRLP
jgi:hypothetical protein